MMTWKGQELRTIGELLKAVRAVATREEAQEFMALYLEEHPAFGRENIGYLTGYVGPEEADRLRDWFGVVHPYFGTDHPTPEEAFDVGRRLGRGEDVPRHPQPGEAP